MKKLIYISLIGTWILVSCEGYLKEVQYTNANFEYFNTADGLETGINGVYQNMRWYAGGYANTNNNTTGADENDFYVSLNEYGTDFTWEGSDGDQKDAFNKYLSSLNPGHEVTVNFWINSYRGITRANTALMYLETVQGMSDNTKIQRAAELRFLRAYFYYDMVQHYGGVPLVIKGNPGSIITDFPRASVADVYKQVISDLKAAYDVLPDVFQQAQRGRATKWAAGHLLAKVYLTRASFDLTTRGGKATDLDSAAFYAQAVINSGRFNLENNFAMVFEQNNQRVTTEIIWDIPFSKDPLFNGAGTSTSGAGNQLHLYWVSQYDTRPGMTRDVENGRPFRQYRVNPNVFLKLWNRQNDSRVYKSFRSVHYCNTTANLPRWDTVFYVDPVTNVTNKKDILYVPDDDKWEMDGTRRIRGKFKFGLGDTAIYYSHKNYEAMTFAYTHSSGKSTLIDDGKYREMLTDIGKSTYLMIPIDRQHELLFPTMLKWLDNQRASMNYVAGSRNFHRMRLSETYLIAAEALGRQGKQTEAIEFINTVRRRAAWANNEIKAHEVYTVYGGANNTLSTASLMEVTWADVTNPIFPSGSGFDPFIDWMLEERARELYGESNRWEDLARTGTLLARVKLYNPEAKDYIQDYHVLRPIPNVHIDRLNPKPEPKDVQNPGYY